MNHLRLSKEESNIYNLKFARSTHIDCLNGSELLQDIIEGEFDICRIKVSADQTDLFTILDDLRINYHLHSVIVRNEKKLTESDAKFKPPSGISFELFNGTQESTLKNLVKRSIAATTAVNYHNPDFRKIVPEENEWDAAANFACSFNHYCNPKKIGWLAKKEGSFLGYAFGTIDENVFDASLYGIIPEYRDQKLSRLFIQKAKKEAYLLHLDYFKTDYVFQNVRTKKSLMKESVSKYTYFNITLNSFFSHTERSLIVKRLKGSSELFSFYQLAINESLNVLGQEWSLINYTIRYIYTKDKGKLSMVLSFPLYRDGEVLVLAKVINEFQKVLAYSYCRFLKKTFFTS